MMSRTSEQVYDELLVLRAQNGDADALEEMFHRWNGRFMRHACRLTGDADASRDIAQEAWMGVVNGLRSLDDPSLFRSWAYRIVTRRCADWIRQAQRRRTIMTALDGSSAPAGSLAAVGQTSLEEAVGRLPRDTRTVLAMHYLDEMDVQEIAASLGIPTGTVKSRLYRARSALRKALEQKTAMEA